MNGLPTVIPTETKGLAILLRVFSLPVAPHPGDAALLALKVAFARDSAAEVVLLAGDEVDGASRALPHRACL